MTNRIIEVLRIRVVELSSGGFFDGGKEAPSKQLESLRIFAFIDAGLGALRDSKSIEAAIVIVCTEVSLGGSIACLGSALGSYSRKISRVARSTIAAESVASANAIEVGSRHHDILTEIVTVFMRICARGMRTRFRYALLSGHI